MVKSTFKEWNRSREERDIPTSSNIFLRDTFLLFRYGIDWFANYHSTLQIFISLGRPLSFRYAGGPWEEHKAILVNVDESYECKVDDELVCALFIPAQSKKAEMIKNNLLADGQAIMPLSVSEVAPILEKISAYSITPNYNGLGDLVDRLIASWSGQDFHAWDMGGKVSKAFHYIEGHFSHDLWEEEVAEQVHQTSGQLNFMFYGQVGMSVREFILWTSIASVIVGVMNGIGEATLLKEAGFESPSDFSQLFKRTFGIPPKKFLTECRKGTRGGASFAP